MDFMGERFVPDAVSGEIAVEHFQRYGAVHSLVRGKRVLDLACGEGYGSSRMAESASRVIGIDIDAATVEAAQKKYVRENLQYVVGSATEIPLPDACVDIVLEYAR